MSYIQIEIGGKKRGLKFLQYATILMSQYADLENYAATAVYAMFYGGLRCNCFVKREEPDFSFEDVCEWVDSLKDDTLQSVYKIFEESQAYKALIEKPKDTVEDVPTKKKLKKTE